MRNKSVIGIVEGIRKIYAECSSYEDTGVVTTTFYQKGRRRVERRPFSTLFVRPDYFRFEFRSRRGEDDWDRYVIWKKGAELETWWSALDRVEQPESLGRAIAGATGISGGSAHRVARMLVPEVSGSSWLEAEDLTDGGTEALNGGTCHRLVIPPSWRGPQTHLVEVSSFLLQRVHEGRHELRAPSFDRIDTKGIPPELLARLKADIERGRTDPPCEVETETTYSPRLNEPIDLARFQREPE